MQHQTDIEFLFSRCVHSYVSSLEAVGEAGLHAETLYPQHYFSALDNRVCFTQADLRLWVTGPAEMRIMWTEGFGAPPPPQVSPRTHMMHTLPFHTTGFISLSISHDLSTAHFLSPPLRSPYHQCKIPHPCRQRQMERAAPAPCSAPVIYATVAPTRTHTHTPMHSRIQYACDYTSADEIACINMQGLAGDTELNTGLNLCYVNVKCQSSRAF